MAYVKPLIVSISTSLGPSRHLSPFAAVQTPVSVPSSNSLTYTGVDGVEMSIILTPSSVVPVTTAYVELPIVVIATPFAPSRHLSPFDAVQTPVSVPSSTVL